MTDISNNATPKKRFRPKWVKPFLEQLARTPNVSDALRAARINRATAYRRRRSDPEFAADWDAALEESTDDLVGESYRRARFGCMKPVFYLGNICGHVQEFSDTLAIFLLKSHRPAVYRDPLPEAPKEPNTLDPGTAAVMLAAAMKHLNAPDDGSNPQS